MKSSELHRLILKNGWRSIRQAGSHVIYEKDGKTVSVPFHGSKEMGSGIARRYKDKTTRTIYTDTRLSDQRRGPASQPRHDRHDKTDYKTGYIIVSRFRRIIQCYG